MVLRKCNHKIHEVYFKLEDIQNQFQFEFNTFYGDKDLRTCKACGYVMEPQFLLHNFIKRIKLLFLLSELVV